MEKRIQINNSYNTLDKLQAFLATQTTFGCTIEYDTWDVRTDSNGQMEKCIILKKSGAHATKLYFENENTVKASYIIPNKIMHAYFGKSVKARRNIIELLAGSIKQFVLAGPQQKAFEELEIIVRKAAP